MEKAIITLCEYPSMGKSGRIDGTREFVVLNTPFIVAYRIAKRILQILSVLHTSKKYPYQ
jgi:plasmid stabilization system protein ParE